MLGGIEIGKASQISACGVGSLLFESLGIWYDVRRDEVRNTTSIDIEGNIPTLETSWTFAIANS